MPDFSAYWFHVLQIADASRIEGRLSPLARDHGDVAHFVLGEIQEAAPDLEHGVQEAERLLAAALRVNDIDCLWSPCLGTEDGPYSYETHVRMGQIDESPDSLQVVVRQSLGAWRASVTTVEREHDTQYAWEALASLESAAQWSEEVCAGWLRVNSVSLDWQYREFSQMWWAKVELRRREVNRYGQ